MQGHFNFITKSRFGIRNQGFFYGNCKRMQLEMTELEEKKAEQSGTIPKQNSL
jgi:hypothetical protein